MQRERVTQIKRQWETERNRDLDTETEREAEREREILRESTTYRQKQTE